MKGKDGGAADPSAIDYKGHKKQFIDFINAIEKNREPLINGIEGRKSVEIILSIYKSAKKEKKVIINIKELLKAFKKASLIVFIFNNKIRSKDIYATVSQALNRLSR